MLGRARPSFEGMLYLARFIGAFTACARQTGRTSRNSHHAPSARLAAPPATQRGILT